MKTIASIVLALGISHGLQLEAEISLEKRIIEDSMFLQEY